MKRGPLNRSQRVLGWAAIGLALAWSLFAQLLWQVETHQSENQPPDVRLVVSAFAPVAPVAPQPANTTTKQTPQAAAQPVLPDGEAPAPCQLRRLISTDLRVLTSHDAKPLFGIPELRTLAVKTTDSHAWLCETSRPHASLDQRPACLPRPPPALS